MSELLHNILVRKSVHRFEKEQIKDSELNEIIEAGKFVSEAIKECRWHFSVIQCREVLDDIGRSSDSFFSQTDKGLLRDLSTADGFHLFCKAPTFVLISGTARSPEILHDAHAVFGNMMLAAEKINVSSCWMKWVGPMLSSGVFTDWREQLSVPEGYVPLAGGEFGYRYGKARPEAKEVHRVLKEGMVHIVR